MIRVLLYGLGPIGSMVARQLHARKGFRIVGAVDIDPAKAGRDVGEVVEVGRRLRVKVSLDASKAIKTARPDVVVLCTSSSLERVMPQIETILRARVPIVTTTEELSYPAKKNAARARRIDAMAKRAKVAVLSTGVNPGFAMDALPIALTAVCERVDSIEVHRVQDARTRRLPFQRKIGAGLTRDAFAAAVAEGSIRHVGLAESISMIADAMGWRLDRITDEIEPKVVDGVVQGIIQDGVGYRKGAPLVRLHMEAYLGAPESYDTATITGHPSLNVTVAGGIPGDIATTSIVINSIPHVLRSTPGLKTMRDLPLPSYFPG